MTISQKDLLDQLFAQQKIAPLPAGINPRTLHFGLRDCIAEQDADSMLTLLRQYGGIDLNATFGEGSLLCFAASAPFLTQGRPALEAPIRLLLEHGANPKIAQDYHLKPDGYRQTTLPPAHGDFNQYLTAMAADIQSTHHKTILTQKDLKIALESIGYIQSLLAIHGMKAPHRPLHALMAAQSGRFGAKPQ